MKISLQLQQGRIIIHLVLRRGKHVSEKSRHREAGTHISVCLDCLPNAFQDTLLSLCNTLESQVWNMHMGLEIT